MASPARLLPRPELRFFDFGEIRREVDQLAQVGYDRAGSWDLPKICDHCAILLEFSMDGFPRLPLPMRLMFTVGRPVTRRFILRMIERGGPMPRGLPGPPALMPVSAGPESPDRLRRALDRFDRHEGPLAASPVAGRLTREQWCQLHLAHCALHLSHLHPKSNAGAI